ncbi:hypothetical protein AVEN_185165-1 [Araneus ventricosus]|uniref:Mos1 transposase HTH domain-containing protein n=1 Tax=Araneus ventricosus TaxID=182803 RepID=A0A4Y2P0J6_ARAVE|nr:hypothetical protein AVEN_185165-1 [Araneus ventricosus]
MVIELEGCTLEKQRSIVRFLWVKELPSKDVYKDMLFLYMENCSSCLDVNCNIVSKLRDAIRRKRPSLLIRRFLFHHSNGRAHTDGLTKRKKN